jgi:NAD+ diphosphatase
VAPEHYFVIAGGSFLLAEDGGQLHSAEFIERLKLQLGQQLSRPLEFTPMVEARAGGDVHVLALSKQEKEHVERDFSWDRAEPQWQNFRNILPAIAGNDFAAYARALQYSHWLNEHRYCGICATPTVPDTTDPSLYCGTCERHWYPRIQPCVIILIHDGDRILLAKHTRYVTDMYSCIAGFVESGESLEQTAIREIKEEVGVDVSKLEYFSSQSWPFPYQLMVGFFAEYSGGDIVIEPEEIADAQWFSVHDLPQIPPTVSISGLLIEAYLRRIKAD